MMFYVTVILAVLITWALFALDKWVDHLLDTGRKKVIKTVQFLITVIVITVILIVIF